MKTGKFILKTATAFFSLVALSACLGDDESYNTAQYSGPGVIGYGELSAPALTSFYVGVKDYGYVVPDDASKLNFEGYRAGDCVMTSFVYDSRNQPEGSVNYLVGNSMKLEPVGLSQVNQSDNPKDTTGYSVLTSEARLFTESSDPFYFAGRVFFTAKNNIYKKQEVHFAADCDYTTTDENGSYTIYLKAAIDGLEGVAEETEGMYAIDLTRLFNHQRIGRDTIYNYGGLKLKMRYININIKYLQSISEDGEPFYAAVSPPTDVSKPNLFFIYQGEEAE
jgi:hypothetical protein